MVNGRKRTKHIPRECVEQRRVQAGREFQDASSANAGLLVLARKQRLPQP